MKHSMDTDMRQLLPADYPEALKHMSDPPPSLWLRGTLPPRSTKLLAVVGSREVSAYGIEACRTLIAGLAGYPISIVSGLALGTDAVAHEAALATGLHTIAIPGSGLNDDVIAPRTNADLAARILKQGGALVSEQAPAHVPFPKDFPSRNRIMAALSDAVLVIEAGERSGTLITARLAAEYNKDLLCVPHRIGDSHGVAAETFIPLGALYTTSAAQILEALGVSRESETPKLDLSTSQNTVYEILSSPSTKQEIITRSKLPEHEALEALIILELKGIAREQYGRWQRTSP